MREEKEQGLVLKSFSYKEREQIITLFTPSRGLISLIVKGMSPKKSTLFSLTTVLTQAEYHFAVSERSDLYRFIDGYVINAHLNLRSSFAHLQAASILINSLTSSQFPGKAAPKLYELTLFYLSKIPLLEDPTPLTASYLLKLLKHEGHLSLSKMCSMCQEAPATCLSLGESFCKPHAPSFAISFNEQEWETLHTLSLARYFKELQESAVSTELGEKIKHLLNEITHLKT